MARPQKQGFDYFPLDTDFLQDDKSLDVYKDFGAKGILVLLRLWTKLYKEKGYYLEFDDKLCRHLSDGEDSSLKKSTVRECILGFVNCSLFDERVFNEFKVLTSERIQKNVLQMISGRSKYVFIKEYWLLNNEDLLDITPKTLNKLVFKSVFDYKNPVLFDKTNINFEKTTQSKVNKNKVNKSSSIQPPSLKEIKDFASEHELNVNADLFFTHYKCAGWKTKKGQYIDDWKSLLIRWSDSENKTKETNNKALQYNKEFDKKQAKIFADRTMFAGGEASGNYALPNDEVYQMVTGDSVNGGVKGLLDVYSPEIRDESFKNASDFNFAILELCCGLSRGVFTKPETSFSTATEMKNSLKKTFAFMKKFRNQIDSGENMLIAAIDILMNLNNISPIGDYEVYSDWSDNYIEEMKERFNQLLQLHNQGVITDAELRAWGMDEDLETAEENVKKIKIENPQTEM